MLEVVSTAETVLPIASKLRIDVPWRNCASVSALPGKAASVSSLVSGSGLLIFNLFRRPSTEESGDLLPLRKLKVVVLRDETRRCPGGAVDAMATNATQLAIPLAGAQPVPQRLLETSYLKRWAQRYRSRRFLLRDSDIPAIVGERGRLQQT